MEVSGDRGAGQHVDVLGLGEAARPLRRPLGLRPTFDRSPGDVGDAAEARRLVGDDHPEPRRRGGLGRCQARDAGTRHQHVAADVHVLVGVGVAAARRLAEPGGPADERLVDGLPERPGPHEGLVVETGGEETGQTAVDRADVELEARPAILADGDEPVVELHLGRALVRLVTVAFADADEPVHLLRPEAHDAARAVILEAPPDEAPPVGEEGGGERVARQARHRLPIECEGDAPRAVEVASGRCLGRQPAGLARHGVSSLIFLRAARTSAHGGPAARIRVSGGSSVMP